MKNYIVEISHSKYRELRRVAFNPNTLAVETGWSRKYYGFDVKDVRVHRGPEEDRVIVLSFDNEQDCIWFQLKHL